MIRRTIPTVTPLQYAYLEVLRRGERSGTEMRSRLWRRGAYTSRAAIYKVIDRLKELRLITARRIRRDSGRSPGSLCCYSLTGAGKYEVEVTLRFYEHTGRGSIERRKRHWRRQPKLCLLKSSNESAERAGAYRSERQ